MQPPSRPLGRSVSAGYQPSRPPQTPNQPPNRNNNFGPNQNGPKPPQQNMQRPQVAGHAGQAQNNDAAQRQTTPHNAQANGQSGTAGGETSGFFSARAVNVLSSQKPDAEPTLPQAPQVGQVFNPHAESPSIRKTPGIDHTTSKPLARTGQHVAPTKTAETGSNAASSPQVSANAMPPRGPSPVGPAARGNVLNPSLDHARRIGAPGGPGSPLSNRGQYRPPTIKRPLDAANVAGRPALAEVPTNGPVGAGGNTAAGDAKRQKMA